MNGATRRRRDAPWFRSLWSSDHPDVLGLRALLSLDDVELHRLPLFEVAVPLPGDAGVVNEHVGTVGLGDEAEPLLGAEPLHGACCHWRSLLPRPVRTCRSCVSVGLPGLGRGGNCQNNGGTEYCMNPRVEGTRCVRGAPEHTLRWR